MTVRDCGVYDEQLVIMVIGNAKTRVKKMIFERGIDTSLEMTEYKEKRQITRHPKSPIEKAAHR